LREGVACVAELSFVAEEGARIVGTVRYWPVVIGGQAALMLGPIAIVADRQGQGIALALMQTSLDEAKRLGHRAVILVGDEPYYGRAGFKRIQPAGRITMPGPVDYARVLGLSLIDSAVEAMKGEVRKAAMHEPVAAAGCAVG
jgi:predicted N-acetyltransferase YhbS